MDELYRFQVMTFVQQRTQIIRNKQMHENNTTEKCTLNMINIDK